MAANYIDHVDALWRLIGGGDQKKWEAVDAMLDSGVDLSVLANPAHAFEAIDVIAYGHSYVGGVNTAVSNSTNGTWWKRLQRRLSTASATDRAVGSTTMADMVGRALGTAAPYVPGTRALYFLDGPLNDHNQAGTIARRLTSYGNSLRTMLNLLTCGRKVESTGSTFTTSGTWTTFTDARCSGGTARQTVEQNASITVAAVTNGATIVFHGVDGAGATVEISVDGRVVQTVDTSNQMLTSGTGLAFCPMSFTLDGYSSDNHTVRLKKTDAGGGALRVDCILYPLADAPNVVVFADAPILHTSYLTAGGDTTMGQINDLAAAIAADYPTVAFADPRPQWNTATCLGQDQIHPNDLGHALYARAAEYALAGLTPSNGTVVRGQLTLPAEPSPFTTPQVSGYPAIPSTAQVFGAAPLVASPFSGFGNAISFDGSSYVSLVVPATGLETGFKVTFKWRTTAASMASNEELVSRYSSDSLVGAGLFRIYNVPTGGAGRLVAQWRKADTTLGQIIGPGSITVGTDNDVELVFDGTTMTLKRNGATVGSLATTVEAPDTTTPLTVGEAPGVSVGKAQSIIDEVRVANASNTTVVLLPLDSKS